ncbi:MULTISPECIES: NAD-dependent malic enzyme [unclassified Algibacter]|uniref:NAD-dependent malic enzyme n=1 Tax=unclassified Algibacter TaxID=2615009 RepID=UPI00131D7666|nr:MULTISPECIES: NAD-dependent malic enzyme [unclassified Algibacter]MCL5129876.1 NAD-dependent malic enzyme [Algibacter sp. L4_22]
MVTNKKGFEVLYDGTISKSLAFSKNEREQLGLRGLLPYSIVNQSVQVKRVIEGLRRKDSDIERYIMLSALQDRNEKLYYRIASEYIEEIMPIIYTPTVGEACTKFSHIFRRAKGFYITPDDKGEMLKILENWPEKDIRVIVITDGQRILGLGDLGANGMGIPIGKLALYTACAGIHPNQCLPVMLDVGTNNKEIREDIMYLGYPKERIEGEAYLELVNEFVMAVQEKYPDALIQFEDFLTPNAYALLNIYKDKTLCFNDDIQGTAAVALAGLYATTRITDILFSDLKIMFLGAGSAATGIADLLVLALVKEGLTKQEALERLWFVDINGLVVSGRTDLMPHNLPYAHNHNQLNFIESINTIKPHAIIGATGAFGAFSKEVIEAMSDINERPIIFALSNPTSKAECTAEQAYLWSKGKAVFASGSPFDKVKLNGKEYRPGQGNNAYIFPGIGLGVIVAKATIIPDEIFLTAAKTLSEMVSDKNIVEGAIYPKLNEIQSISLEIALSVAEKAFELGITRIERPKNLKQTISDYMYNPYY